MEKDQKLEEDQNTFTDDVKVPALLIDLIPKYLENRRIEVHNLEEAVKSKDFPTIQSIGHKLKGNAGSYGFMKLTHVGASLERAGKESDIESAQNCVRTYVEYLDHVKVFSV